MTYQLVDSSLFWEKTKPLRIRIKISDIVTTRVSTAVANKSTVKCVMITVLLRYKKLIGITRLSISLSKCLPYFVLSNICSVLLPARFPGKLQCFTLTTIFLESKESTHHIKASMVRLEVNRN